jgi:hypothetical protein
MTRKEYVKFANLLNDFRVNNQDRCNLDMRDVCDWFESNIAQVFAEDNTRFDRQRFYEACRKEEKKAA